MKRKVPVAGNGDDGNAGDGDDDPEGSFGLFIHSLQVH